MLIPGIMEHVERAGVHSGDSMAVYPGVNLELDSRSIRSSSTHSGSALVAIGARGLINIQYVVVPSPEGAGIRSVYVIEVNPRGSRTVPFLSKVTGVPMVEVAVNIMLGRSLAEQGYSGGLWPKQPLVAVKAPVFSMSKLIGVDTYLGPEMKSTGEVMGVDRTYPAALAKALLASGLMLAPNGAVLMSIADKHKRRRRSEVARLLAAGRLSLLRDGGHLGSAAAPLASLSSRCRSGSRRAIRTSSTSCARAW